MFLSYCLFSFSNLDRSPAGC